METPTTTETAEQKRKRQLRESKQKQRAREAAQGVKCYSIKLTGDQARTIYEAGALYNGAAEEFLSRALLVGAKFLANSGNVRGGKVRVR